MQKELEQENTGIPIQIIGINHVDKISGNMDITDGRDLPWLQDTTEDNVWDLWVHEHRDVIILNAKNERVGVFGLTNHDLSRPGNYQQLKQMLLDAAQQ